MLLFQDVGFLRQSLGPWVEARISGSGSGTFKTWGLESFKTQRVCDARFIDAVLIQTLFEDHPSFLFPLL